jgi:hypothetical protein
LFTANFLELQGKIERYGEPSRRLFAVVGGKDFFGRGIFPPDARKGLPGSGNRGKEKKGTGGLQMPVCVGVRQCLSVTFLPDAPSFPFLRLFIAVCGKSETRQDTMLAFKAKRQFPPASR